MIRRVLLPLLEARFPGRGLRAGIPPDPVAVFPAIRDAVGDASIRDDGDEATVEIGAITHGHFSARGPRRRLGREMQVSIMDADDLKFLRSSPLPNPSRR